MSIESTRLLIDLWLEAEVERGLTVQLQEMRRRANKAQALQEGSMRPQGRIGHGPSRPEVMLTKPFKAKSAAAEVEAFGKQAEDRIKALENKLENAQAEL
ncbi:hypothetical protein ACLOJK_008473 [Asimina triloba]